MRKTLNLFSEYDRKGVHKIFDNGITKFTPGAGIWGLHGIVSIAERKNDYVLFVTFGQNQFGQEFKESLTEDGILFWQSQPMQDFVNKHIINFVNHDYLQNNIYLFLRTRKLNPATKKGELYTYMGKLAFLEIDKRKQKPVEITWQIIDWELPNETIQERMNIKFSDTRAIDFSKTIRKKALIKNVDYVAQNKKNRELGLEGELFVLKYLKQTLIDKGLTSLVEKVSHTSVEEGDGAGYDIRSFDEWGNTQHIEVKTTTGGEGSRFFISSNELSFSKQNKKSYQLYRVYNFDSKNNTGDFNIYQGDISKIFDFEATNFQGKIKSIEDNQNEF